MRPGTGRISRPVNRRRSRQVSLTFPDAGKSYALRSQLTWTHWRLVMRVENPQARDYCIGETARQQWSSRALERAIEIRTCQRLLKASEPSALTAPPANPLHFLGSSGIIGGLDP